MRGEEPLFSNIDWFSVDQNQRDQLKKEVEGMAGDRLLNTSVDDLCAYLEEKYTVNVPALRRGDIEAGQRETQLDVSGDRRRFGRDHHGPFYVAGTQVQVSVPYDGDEQVFLIRPTTFTMNNPRGAIHEGWLILYIEGTALTPEGVKAEVDRRLTDIEGHLERLRENARGLNPNLNALAHDAVNRRRQKLLADRNLVANLGFKLQERPGAARTYPAPEVRRKTPTLPPASTEPYQLEPALTDADYEHILGIVENMAQVMERDPDRSGASQL